MIGTRRAGKRLPAIAGLLAVTLLLSGCVFLRLLELKKQIGQFEKHFVLQTHEGIRIICQTPVLLDDDVRWLGMRPETTRRLGRAEEWQMRWTKDLPPGVTDSGTFFIGLQLVFTEGKLSSVTIPETYFALIPKSFVITMLKSMGGGAVDKAGRKLESTVAADAVRAARPKLPAIDKVLGKPTEERTEGVYSIQKYVYRPVSKEPGGGTFEMTLRFNTTTGDLVHWHGKMPVGNISFKFDQ